MLYDLSDIDHVHEAIQVTILRDTIMASLATDGLAAHRLVFGGNHEFETPAFHALILADFHSAHPRVAEEAFRGAAKSTLAEEAISLRMAAGLFSYGLLLGNTYGAAAQRLASIKAIIDNNRVIYRVFGDLRGPTWNEGHIKLRNGTVLEAIGARQSIRGFKEESARPDFLLIDDLEDETWVKTPEAIEANKLWLFKEVVPALASSSMPIRMIGTPLAENSLLRQLSESSEWLSRRFPIRYLDQSGYPTSAWPEKFTLEQIDAIERQYTSLGAHTAFMQEYMCESSSEQERIFTADMLRTEPRVRTWQSVYCMIDPARTTKATSAQTGWAAWSWDAGGRLSVWECDGARLQPDRIIDLCFRLNETYGPVEIGVEEDGLNEWLMQPIRDAQSKRGLIPVRAIKAPRGKVDFIKGLQPFMVARTATFCLEGNETAVKFGNAFKQFLTFPRDVIDAPNALAYATSLRPGVPVYSDFGPDAVEVSEAPSHRPSVLSMNADGSRVTAHLMQNYGDVVRILAEWVEEGQAGDVVPGIVREAGIMAPAALTISIGRHHVENRYANVGLNQALKTRCNVVASIGGEITKGRMDVRDRLRSRTLGRPRLLVSNTCRFTLNGFAAGYAYPVVHNVVATEPTKGLYRTLIEGLEAFMGGAVVDESAGDVGNWQRTPDGRTYRSARRT